jgi:predicted negative regulator of RcsB-dependent stress response
VPSPKEGQTSDKILDALETERFCCLTRHELKEQLQHDAFRDHVDVAIDYVVTHQRQAVRWVAIAVAIAVVAGIGYGVFRYQKNKRDHALQAALDIAGAPVIPKPDGFGLTYASEQSKNSAAAKALGEVASSYSGSEQGAVAQYYLAGIEAGEGRNADAERNFKAVANTGFQVSSLARTGLAELYAGTGRIDEAKTVLEDLVAKPNSLVSREQATILLANVLKDQDPKRATQLVQSLKGPLERPAVARAAEEGLQDSK